LTRNELLRYIFWEWIEPIGSALCIALIVMKFIMALYVIPTGSMQPTLRGQNDYGQGDKVLVNKFIYRFEKPKRWDVIVFEFPYISVTCDNCERDLQDLLVKTEKEAYGKGCYFCSTKPVDLSFMRKDYIKRCVAVPGDEISIRDGNLVLKKDGQWKPSRKTLEAQDSLWREVFNSDDEETMNYLTAFWKGTPGFENWKYGSDLVFKPGQEHALLYYQRNLLRGFGDAGHKGRGAPLDGLGAPPFVGDVKMSLSLNNLPAKGKLELEISRNYTPHICEVDFTSKKILLKIADQVLNEMPFKDLSQIAFARVDGQLVLELGDQMKTFEIPNFNASDRTETIMPKLRYQGDQLNIEQVQLFRDIYYYKERAKFFTGPDQSYKVMPGEYFAMGDNSPASYDSRNWGAVPEEKLIGKGLFVFWPTPIKLIY
jgi:signal peptidase I